MNDAELLPCPSGHAEAKVTRDYHFHVECMHHDCPWALKNFQTRADAVAAWNDRLRASPDVVVDGWLPIESAPKDGTQILAALIVRGYGEEWWERHVIACNEDFGDIDINSDFYHGWRWDDYTHWRPLPPPPNTASAIAPVKTGEI